MEALLRWSHPDMGMVSPVQFIPVAEETGLIVPIGMWVLRTACAQNVAWHKSGLPRLPVSVNLSARQFGDDHLLENITNVLHEAGMSPHYLELEVTESMIMLDVPKAVKVLAALRKMGVRIAIDDFGTGYSSLSTLEKFPIDTIKVDRSFIRDLPENTGNKAITEAVITMGKNLGMTVVAEGVETQDQLEFLRDHACDQLQGYYFNKPMPADMFAEFVRSRLAMHSETQERKKNIA
jgi:EAL domain-containing protein (putative c-di-GMP-specific phosphodiesterase class I)